MANTPRGPVIDQEALITSLRNGKIAAVGLGVLTEPPISNEPVLGLENAILTPHIAWYSEQSSSRLQENAALEAERILTGKLPKHLVNPQVLSKRKSPWVIYSEEPGFIRNAPGKMDYCHSAPFHRINPFV